MAGMQRHRIALFLAASTAMTIPAGAASIGGSLAATSRASVRISVSVRPRMGVIQPARGGSDRSLCFWSTGTERRFHLTLTGVARQHAPAAIDALPSAVRCSTDRAQILLGKDGPGLGTAALLLIAPD